MKHTTIALILLIITQLAHSQQIIIHNDNDGMLYMPNNFDSSRWVNCDTMPCIMQISDTAFHYYIDSVLVIDTTIKCDHCLKMKMIPGDTVKLGYNNNIYWIKGYKVDKNNYHLLSLTYYPIEYLDENKKVLSKNIVVWMTK